MSRLQPRQWVLAGALALTLLAIYLVNANEDAEDLTEPRTAAPRPRLTPMPSSPLTSDHAQHQSAGLPDLALARARQAQAMPQAGKDLWQTHAWHVAPPPSQPSAAALAEIARPVVPALPYQYMGQMDDAPGGNLVFLTAGNRVFSVSPGQTVEQVWRLDSVDQRALYLTYLPLNSTVVLSKTAKPVVALAPSPEDQPTDR
jgi:hypothetical protein